MTWEDLTISIVVLVFTLTIIPIIRAKVVMPKLTTVPMVLGAVALTIAYISLGLWLSVAVETASAMLWAIVMRRSFS